MYFLSFETSTKNFSLALSHDEKVIRFRNIKSDMVLEDSILPTVDKMLEAAGIKFNQIDGFAIGLGPGSFTSLRVGLATIKAFAMATNKPVVAIPSMDVIAQGITSMLSSKGKAYDEICVLNDARRGKVYACLYNTTGRISDYLLASLEDILGKVKGNTLYVGDAIEIYRESIEAAYKKSAAKKKPCTCTFADVKWWYPQASVMAEIAFKRFQEKTFEDIGHLQPLYLYPQDCQVSPSTTLPTLKKN